jgi:hypothetical protein
LPRCIGWIAIGAKSTLAQAASAGSLRNSARWLGSAKTRTVCSGKPRAIAWMEALLPTACCVPVHSISNTRIIACPSPAGSWDGALVAFHLTTSP